MEEDRVRTGPTKLRDINDESMSVRIHLRDQPQRSIALVTGSHALVFRHSPSNADPSLHGPLHSSPSAQSRGSINNVAVPRCMVEFSALDAINLEDYKTLSLSAVQGTLGLITINDDVFLCVVSSAARVATVRPGETVQRISSVEFCESIPSLQDMSSR